MKPRVLIVDGYSSGNLLPPELHERGFDCLHLQSTKEIFPLLQKSFRPNDYVKNFIFDDNWVHLVKELRTLDITAVIPGTETGVHLADHLSETLQLKTNRSEKSLARRHKFLMLETLRKSGVAVARQTISSSAADLIAFKNDFDRVVVKPVESAGAEDVRLCATDHDVIAAHRNIIGKINSLGLSNKEAIIQEYLEGEEYFINSVSLNGHHVVTDIWRHNKKACNNYDFVYDRAELVDEADASMREIIAYNETVLNALNIRFGPSHNEIIVTKKGPRLVEMGARLQGMTWPKLNQTCRGFGPVDLTIDAYVDENQFLAKSNRVRPKKCAMRVNLLTTREGRLKNFALRDVEALKTFFYARPIASINADIKKTINYFTVAGFVLLVGDETSSLLDDYRAIRQLEKSERILIYE